MSPVAKGPRGAAAHDPYPPISDYGFISDGHSVALVSSAGSIDWCCMPRVDAASIFGRLLDWGKGGYCSIAPVDPDATSFQAYLDDTLEPQQAMLIGEKVAESDAAQELIARIKLQFRNQAAPPRVLEAGGMTPTMSR